MRSPTRAWVVVLCAAAVVAAGCTSSGHHSSAPAPQLTVCPTDDDHWSWCSNNPDNMAATSSPAQAHEEATPTGPRPTDSAGFPQLTEGEKEELRGDILDGQCHMFLIGDRGFLIYPDRHMEFVVIVNCIVPTWQQTTVITADRRDTNGDWENKGVFVSASAPAGGNVDNRYVVDVDQCESGVWSGLIYITGIGNDKRTPYSTGVQGARSPALATTCTPNVDMHGNPLHR